MKARLFIFMALVLGLVSCQNDPDEMNVSLGGEQEVMLTVSLPEATRADSADGALDNGVLTNYDLRYILEVYYGEKCNRFVQTSTSTSAVFPVRLAPGRTYTFVVWADFVTKGADAEQDIDLFYETSAGLKAIQIVEENWTPMVEARDAYVGSKTVADFQTSSNLEMTLTRPFAKVRVVSTDIEQLRGVGIVPTTAQATYSQNMYRKFNAATGVASDAATKTHTFAYANVDSYETNTDSKLTIFSDYIFVPAEGVAKFTLEVWDGEATPRSIKQNNFNTDIFVEKNKVTSIVGDVLTTGGNVKVTIDGELGEKETITIVDNAQSLQDAINNAPDGEETTIELGGDIDLNDLFGISTLSTRAGEPAYALLVDADKEVALDLKGFTISYEKTQTANFSMIQNDGKLTIVDSSAAKTGKIVYTDKGQGGNFISNTITNRGTLIVKGGKIDNDSSDAVADVGFPYAIDTSIWGEASEVVVNIEGGTIESIYSPLRVRADSQTEQVTANISGGVINGRIDHQMSSSKAGVLGALNITGGEFNPFGVTDNTIMIFGAGVDTDASGITVAISGGKFNAPIKVYRGAGVPIGSNFNDKFITGGTFNSDPSSFVAEGYKVVENNGRWTIAIDPVAKIGETEYATLEAAAETAENGDTITVLKDVALSSTLTLPAGITFNGNGKQIDGTISAGGDLTFVGHTKVTSFSASYYNRVITIGEGACLEVTGTGRVTLGYGNTFHITGSVENAKTAVKEDVQPSLIIPAGISITGGNDAAMNVTDAYVKIGSTTSKPGVASGTFTLNFNNAIAEFTKEFGFYDPTGSANPTFVMNITDSVFTTGAKLFVTANSTVTVDNSNVPLGTYFRNSGTFTLTNGSVMTGATIQFGENGGNNGTINVDKSTLTITTGNNKGHAFDGQGIGKISAVNGATVSVEYYKDMTIEVDETSTFIGTDIYANRKIYYTGDTKLVPTNPEAINATIESSAYDSKTGKGVITFDKDVTTIGAEAFYRTDNTTPSNWMTSITLPESVKTIGNKAFYQCFSLETINIPDSVETIGEYAFHNCNAVTSVTIGSNVKHIASGAFYTCYEIKEIVCKPTTAPTLADKWVFYNVEPERVVVPAASVDAYKAAWSEFADVIVAGEL